MSYDGAAAMSLTHLLKILLVAELVVFGLTLVAGVTLWRRSVIARRVAEQISPAASSTQLAIDNAVTGEDPQAAQHPLIRFALKDLSQAERDVLPWMMAEMKFGATHSAEIFVIGRLLLVVVGAAASWTLIESILRSYDLGYLPLVIAAVAGAIGNWFLARNFVKGAVLSRSDRVAHSMPYALDLVLICLDSGAGLETAMARVAAELKARDPLVAEELTRTLLDINVIGNREQAFRNLGDRIGTVNMNAIVTVLSQSLQYGSSLSEALRGAISTMKRTELIALEERAGKLPVQLSLPGMALTFPQVIILLAGPGVLDLLDTFTAMQR